VVAGLLTYRVEKLHAQVQTTANQQAEINQTQLAQAKALIALWESQKQEVASLTSWSGYVKERTDLSNVNRGVVISLTDGHNGQNPQVHR
jgi:hypothetical protein